MDKFLEFVVDKVFSFGAFCILLVLFFMFLISMLAKNDIDRQAHERNLTEICYNRNMILIDTAAGYRCIDPRALVKVD